MLTRVREGRGMYNNNSAIARSSVLTGLKVYYYILVALVYRFCGCFAQVVMVNSTWTSNHISALWGCSPLLVHPPCDTTALQDLPLERAGGGEEGCYVVSVAQFRPEKDHRAQLRAWALARRHAKVLGSRLKVVGGVRNDGDAARLEALRQYAAELGVQDQIDFCVGVQHLELKRLLGGAVAGLHTMLDEHFGISVVEYMAAGAVPIAHASGGPKADIVIPETVTSAGGVASRERTGFLASSDEEYAKAIEDALDMNPSQRLRMAGAARQRSQRFSTEAFMKGFIAALKPAFHG
ncbi:hypothetical protein CYMTET_32626 [Cymbomonas tetramitiformis]|uniref:GDP-Man:Man(3)GlcNAc(2)-PP-Dol alpha-1,2-mannosyltransferase n=1 Tax=Cymbomonas tetramitiformis TaxID=36881 RepID=A0AAE0FEH0_9CHLO|nr:hypothetical protein CYMTET_32626 [Cymbomonas tetramitiformis]